jgi:NAD(P)-dependent dehydrogenase (short-subunit alcohol dehydrogenase family)
MHNPLSNTAGPMSGKTVIVTGATAGIGEVTAVELARQGADVVLISRNPARLQATAARIQQATGYVPAQQIAADLSRLADTRRAAAEFLAHHDRLDVLVNNAGALFMQRQVSLDGFEMTFALNHLSYFLLTNLLLETLKVTAARYGEARIVSVSSNAHRRARIDFDDLQLNRSYAGFDAYGRSKAMNVLFTYELARRLLGTGVTANCLHPGFVATRFAKNNGWPVKLVMAGLQFFALDPHKGALTSIFLASSPEVKGVTSAYFSSSKPTRSDPVAYDPITQARLWQVSLQLTGIGDSAIAA